MKDWLDRREKKRLNITGQERKHRHSIKKHLVFQHQWSKEDKAAGQYNHFWKSYPIFFILLSILIPYYLLTQSLPFFLSFQTLILQQAVIQLHDEQMAYYGNFMETMNRVKGVVFPLDTLAPIQAAFAVINHLYIFFGVTYRHC